MRAGTDYTDCGVRIPDGADCYFGNDQRDPSGLFGQVQSTPWNTYRPNNIYTLTVHPQVSWTRVRNPNGKLLRDAKDHIQQMMQGT